jgi:hypothetical protein
VLVHTRRVWKRVGRAGPEVINFQFTKQFFRPIYGFNLGVSFVQPQSGRTCTRFFSTTTLFPGGIRSRDARVSSNLSHPALVSWQKMLLMTDDISLTKIDIYFHYVAAILKNF